MNNLAEMQAVGQDFEFYPTTNAIIAAFFNHAKALDLDSLADIGAGNGKVLLAFNTRLPF